jgi:hypothetical protein
MTAVVEGVADTSLRCFGGYGCLFSCWVRSCMVRLCVMMAVQYYDVMSMNVERAMKLL